MINILYSEADKLYVRKMELWIDNMCSIILDITEWKKTHFGCCLCTLDICLCAILWIDQRLFEKIVKILDVKLPLAFSYS